MRLCRNPAATAQSSFTHLASVVARPRRTHGAHVQDIGKAKKEISFQVSVRNPSVSTLRKVGTDSDAVA